MIKAVTELLETGFRAFPVVCYFTWISKFVQNILFRTKRNQPSNLHCTPLTCFLSYNKICALNCSRVTCGIKITGWFPQCLACFLFHFISISFLFRLFSCHIETGWKIFITTRSVGYKWIILLAFQIFANFLYQILETSRVICSENLLVGFYLVM